MKKQPFHNFVVDHMTFLVEPALYKTTYALFRILTERGVAAKLRGRRSLSRMPPEPDPLFLSASRIEALASFRSPEPDVLSLHLSVDDGGLYPGVLRQLLKEQGARLSNFANDLARFERFVTHDFVPGGHRGLAVYSCAKRGLFEAFGLPQVVKTDLVADECLDLVPLRALRGHARSRRLTRIARSSTCCWCCCRSRGRRPSSAATTRTSTCMTISRPRPPRRASLRSCSGKTGRCHTPAGAASCGVSESRSTRRPAGCHGSSPTRTPRPRISGSATR